jgi:hypothetical protein
MANRSEKCSIAQRQCEISGLEAAAVKLKPAHLKELKAILTEVAARARDRNRIVHGIWGVSDGYPDALLLGTVQAHIKMRSFQRHANRHGLTKEELDSGRFEHPDDIVVYVDADFEAVEARIAETADRMGRFIEVLNPPLMKMIMEDARRASEASAKNKTDERS